MPQDRDATRLIEVSATFRMMSAKGIYVTSSPSLTIPIITTEVLETEQWITITSGVVEETLLPN